MSVDKKQTTGLVPRLRFPEFRDADGWRDEKLEELVTTVSPPAKLQTSSYLTQGRFPIIDQSQEAICGWTNDESTLITESLPLIVFGDHTCALKFVEKPFAQGADGIKILKTKPIIFAAYLFQSLNHSPLVMEDYKRHFSILKERAVCFPDIRSGEQQKIADCLSSLDDLITAESQKLDTLKTHKKGLMQQLFPREGETQPRLRFSEFRKAGEWKVKLLGDTAKISSGGTPNRAEPDYWGGSIPWVTTSLINFNRINGVEEFITTEGLNSSSAKLFPAGTLLMAMYGQGKTRGKVALLNIEATTNQACAAIMLNSNVDANFAFQNLASRYEEIRKLSNEGGQENLSAGLIKEISLVHPCLAEQQRIADCLSSFDEIITAQSQKIETLKTHKKGLMQQIFPVMESLG